MTKVKMVKELQECNKCLIIIASLVIVSIVFAGWWHYWQAPYRTLKTFLRALEVGDIKTLYDLTPPHERKQANVTPELIEKTYKELLKPLLSEYRLVRIQRTSAKNPWIPEILIKDIHVPFWLWYRNAEGKTLFTAAHVMRYPGEKGWKIPFGLFVWKLGIAAYGRERIDEMLMRLGYDLIADYRGTGISVKRDLMLMQRGIIKTPTR